MSDLADPAVLLRMLIDRGASDLHCKAGSVPVVRISGELQRVGDERFTAEIVARLAQAMLSPEQQQELLREGSVVGAYSAPGIGRFRVAIFRQRGSAAIVVHAVPHDIRRLEDLALPRSAEDLAGLDRGLVLVSSPVGNGATTTMGALIDHINRNRRCHIVTVEDPIELLHRDAESIVSQLEVGADIASIADGVRAASRFDADVVAVADIGSREVALAVLDAVSRGRLVLAELGGDTVRNVVNGFLDLFTFEERPIFRRAFARAVAGILVQQLLPGTGDHRVLVAETLVKTPKIEAALADEDRMSDLPALLSEGDYKGMQTLDQSLRERVKSGLLTEAVALDAAVDPEELRIELLRS